MRRFLADTFALIVFSTVAGASVEFLVARLSPQQVMHARLAAIPVILVIARPYGIYRDWLFRACRIRDNDQAKAAVFDMLANVTFQAPVYAVILFFAGASLTQIMVALASAAVILTISGRPYGLFLDWCRKLFQVRAEV
jgi:L-alanine exporter